MTDGAKTAIRPESKTDPLELRLADVLDGYVAALERGDAAAPAALVDQHPELAELLPEYLEGIDWIHQAMGAGSAPDDDTAALPLPVASPEGARCIGDFQLCREIGRGGMGVVYEAVQLSLNRRVALKMLPFAAVLDERQTARFRTEAQAAAGLHHPNIVPVFAVGQERGVHYYAMQFIEGRSLAEAIDEVRRSQPDTTRAPRTSRPEDTTRTLHADAAQSTHQSIRETAYFRYVAQLGVQAARALDHAHQFGVVHRDIKPSNLMLDRHSKLWVADFGLARVQSEMSVTLPGDIVGTLRYMSPEQANGRGDLVDGRTDVYALGATLYEMVTLCPAHPGENHQTLLERINASAPTPLRKLNGAAPVDLETIILRAMEKSRDDRYATAGEFADDLERFLEGKTTLARRPNVLERAARFVARRREAAVAAGLAMAVITALAIASAVWVSAANQRTHQALADSQRNLALAESHFRQAREVVDHFGGDIADRMAHLPGAEPLRQELLLDTLQYYQRFLRSAAVDPDLEVDLGATHFKSAAIAERLGDHATAEMCYQQAIDRWRTVADGATADETKEALALGLSCAARMRAAQGDSSGAERLFLQAIERQRRLLAARPDDAPRAAALAETLCNYGLVARRTGKGQQGVERMRQGVALYERAIEQSPDDPRLLRDLAVAQNNLSEALRRHSLEDALAASTAARATMRRLADLEGSRRHLAEFAMANNNLAALQGARGDWEAAADLYAQAVEQTERLVAMNPLIPRRRRELAIAQGNLGLALSKLGELQRSLAAFDAAEAVLTDLAADFPQQAVYPSSLAALSNNRGVALRDAGRQRAATAAFARSVAQQEAAIAKGAPNPLQLAALDRQYQNYADALRGEDRVADAAAIDQKRQDLASHSLESSSR